jgi:hypothetical protein
MENLIANDNFYAQELSVEEMENLSGGFCGTLEYWEALGDALAGRNASMIGGANWYAYNSLYLSLWGECFS